MPKQVVNGAVTKCTMGIGPSSLVVLPANRVLCFNQPAANIMDYKPFVNIIPFPLCQAKANPTVIAATAAAMGTPTPAACVPSLPAPWTPGAATAQVANFPALNDSSTCMCAYSGTISIGFAGQATTDIP